MCLDDRCGLIPPIALAKVSLGGFSPSKLGRTYFYRQGGNTRRGRAISSPPVAGL